jgi:hypothetical protein
MKARAAEPIKPLQRSRRREIGVTSTNRSCGARAAERQGVRQTQWGALMIRNCVRDVVFVSFAVIGLGALACGSGEALRSAVEGGASTDGAGATPVEGSGGSAGSGGIGGSPTVESSDGGAGSGGAGGASSANCRPAPPCPMGWFVNDDEACSYPPTSSPPCQQSSSSNGLCYQRCTTAADCTDSVFPVCGSISVFEGTDYLHPIGVCQGVQYISGCPNLDRG